MQLQENTYFDKVEKGGRNRYYLKKRLGSGGFSEVWLAEDNEADGMKVALKVYASAGGLEDDGIQMFRHDFSLLFNYNHTNLLTPRHYDVYEKRPYLVMPFCEQGSAQKLINKISEEDAWRFLYDVASGLAFLHSLEPPVIHQDISAENILINDRGDFLITDFGVSIQTRRTLRQSAVASQHSQDGGNVDFMGPERFEAQNDPVKASDIWALGVTLYELLEGRLPFPMGLGGLAQKGGADIPTIAANYSKELKNLVYKMLSKNTWDRPTAKAIRKKVRQHWNGHSSKNTNKKREKIVGAIVGAAVGAVVAVVIIVTGVVDFSTQPEKQPDSSAVTLQIDTMNFEQITENVEKAGDSNQLKEEFEDLPEKKDNDQPQPPKANPKEKKVKENSSTIGVRYLGKDFKPRSDFKEKIFSFEVIDHSLCLKKITEKVNEVLVEEEFQKVSEQDILKQNIGIFTQKNDNCYVIDKSEAIIKVTAKKETTINPNLNISK